jgi:hypothetical protein
MLLALALHSQAGFRAGFGSRTLDVVCDGGRVDYPDKPNQTISEAAEVARMLR